MVKCPSCGEKVGVGRLMSVDLRHVPCTECPAILSIQSHLALLLALALILVGPPVAKAVQGGELSVTVALIGGLGLLLVMGRVGYALSSARLLRMRHVPLADPLPGDGSNAS